MGWTLGIVFVAAAAVLGWRLKSRSDKEPSSPEAPLSDSYVLRGNVEVTSTCDGSLEAFPRTIKVTAALDDGRQTRSVVSAEVGLEPLPVSEDGEARFEGTYELAVPWTGSRPPRYWDPPRATGTDGAELCVDLTCEGPNRAVNIASRPRRIQLVNLITEFTLRIACICVPD